MVMKRYNCLHLLNFFSAHRRILIGTSKIFLSKFEI